MNPRPTTSTRGLTCRELFARSDRRVAQEIINEQVKLIDSAILSAHTAGFNHIEYELPIYFNINNLDKADAQTFIYSEILMIYRNPEAQGGKGYTDVSIELRAKAILRISWMNSLDEEERKRRRDYIRTCMRMR